MQLLWFSLVLLLVEGSFVCLAQEESGNESTEKSGNESTEESGSGNSTSLESEEETGSGNSTSLESEEGSGSDSDTSVESDGVVDLTPLQDGGVLKEIKTEGSGDAHPVKGDEVFVHYVGKLTDGTVFDSSHDRGEQYTFIQGIGQVIQCYEIFIPTMKKGEIAVITCTSQYAYGEHGSGTIPPNATLIFEVELIDFKEVETWESQDSIEYTMVACEGHMSHLTCPPSYTIQIIDALWGRDDTTTCVGGNDRAVEVMCNQSWAYDEVWDRCNGKESCDLSASIAVFGDPCNGEAMPMRYLRVDYACQQIKINGLLCENSGMIPVACPENQFIVAHHAFYGRDDNTTCAVDGQMSNTSCSTDAAWQVFKYKCEGLTTCDMRPSSLWLGDPCPGTYKFLWLSYSCAECKNEHGSDADCEYWANQGQCVSNADWMIPYCRKACWRCDKEPPACENAHWDQECDAWADNGDCSSDSAWMHAYCKKSCRQCETACYDKQPPALCHRWAQENECSTNQEYMFANCTRSCFECDGSVQCANLHGNDYECDNWAMKGECGLNPAFMIARCFKSCTGCSRNPVCENAYRDDSLCDRWASEGECEYSPQFMYKNCWKSCIQCHEPIKCENKQSDDDCEFWARDGECNYNPAFMYDQCHMSCTRCKAVKAANTCVNDYGNDDECADWAWVGECYMNPLFMFSQCRKHCTNCDFLGAADLMVGNLAVIGEANSLTQGKTILLPGEFPVDARVTHFTAFFVNRNPVYVQIWRPNQNGSLELVHNQWVWPEGTNLVQNIWAYPCVTITAGDRVGFTTMAGVSPIASLHDLDAIYTGMMIKDAAAQGSFQEFSLPFVFSLGASYDDRESC